MFVDVLLLVLIPLFGLSLLLYFDVLICTLLIFVFVLVNSISISIGITAKINV